MNLLLFSIGLLIGTGLGVWLNRSVFVWAFDKYIKTLEDMGKDLEEVFDSLPVEPIQINDNTIYTVMGGSERIH